MKLSYIAAQVESAYYNGRVQSDDKKLDFDDFMQLVISANGDIMRDIWYDENQRGNPNLYFYSALTTERFETSKRGRFSIVKFEEGGAVKLPHAMGILRVAPAGQEEEHCEDDDEDNGDDFTRGAPGMESTFGSQDMLTDLGERFYVPIGNTLRLFGASPKYVEIDYIKNNEYLDIPEGVAWKIFNIVLGPVLKVVGFP